VDDELIDIVAIGICTGGESVACEEPCQYCVAQAEYLLELIYEHSNKHFN
jgi:hypothetical protein